MNLLPIGEYFSQFLVSWIGGTPAVVLFQIALQLCTAICVFRIGRLTLVSCRLSFVAALLYATLPHNLVFPHQLASEAIAVPFVVIGYWLFLEYRVAKRSLAFLLLAGVMIGLSACVRPVLLLLTILLLPFAPRRRSLGAIGAAISFAAIGFLPILLWVGFVYSATHQLSLGHTGTTGGSLGETLYERVVRIASSRAAREEGALPERYLRGIVDDSCLASPGSVVDTPCRLTVRQYAAFVLHYPLMNIHSIARST
jgi:4-amino-4-deoxy-L-arabinose transferase-like glycosyltransferase